MGLAGLVPALTVRMRLPEPSGSGFVLSHRWLKTGSETVASLVVSASRSSGVGGWKRVVLVLREKCFGSFKLGGLGANGSHTQHMA